jgi:hypothetical protein
MGLVNYLRDFIPLYSELAAPLEKMKYIPKFKENDWTPEAKQSMEAFRKIIAHAPILEVPLDGIPYTVWTDASNTGIGAALIQMVEDKPRFILFASKSLTEGQRNYSATRRELLAIIFALLRFREYLYLESFQLYTDHKALCYMLTQEHLNNMLNEWIEIILDFDFTIHHKPGILNELADCLSRCYPPFMHIRRQINAHTSSSSSSSSNYSFMQLDEYINDPNSTLTEFIKQRLDKTYPEKEEREPLI